jgi:hypothetical protein
MTETNKLPQQLRDHSGVDHKRFNYTLRGVVGKNASLRVNSRTEDRFDGIKSTIKGLIIFA